MKAHTSPSFFFFFIKSDIMSRQNPDVTWTHSDVPRCYENFMNTSDVLAVTSVNGYVCYVNPQRGSVLRMRPDVAGPTSWDSNDVYDALGTITGDTLGFFATERVFGTPGLVILAKNGSGVLVRLEEQHNEEDEECLTLSLVFKVTLRDSEGFNFSNVAFMHVYGVLYVVDQTENVLKRWNNGAGSWETVKAKSDWYVNENWHHVVADNKLYVIPKNLMGTVIFVDFETIEESDVGPTCEWQTLYTIPPPVTERCTSAVAIGSPDGMHVAVCIPDDNTPLKKDWWYFLDHAAGRWIASRVSESYSREELRPQTFFHCGKRVVFAPTGCLLRSAPCEDVMRDFYPPPICSSTAKLRIMAEDGRRDVVYLDADSYAAVKDFQEGDVVPIPVAAAHLCLLEQYEYFKKSLVGWGHLNRRLRHKKGGPIIDMLCLPTGDEPLVKVIIDWIYERLDMSAYKGDFLLQAAGEYLVPGLMCSVLKYVAARGSIEQICTLYGNTFLTNSVDILDTEKRNELLGEVEKALVLCAPMASEYPAIQNLAEKVPVVMPFLMERVYETWKGNTKKRSAEEGGTQGSRRAKRV